MRLLWPIPVLVAAVAVALALAAPATARTRYCQPTGETCTSVAPTNGIVWLSVRTRSLRGKVRICVKGPSGGPVCHRYPLRKSGARYVAKTRWSRSYPNRGSGAYVVTFFWGRLHLGPVLTFHVR
jgi:hypothetical protein